MSLSKTLTTTLSIACLAIGMTAVQAKAEEREFALVFKVLNNAFSPPIQAGCEAAAKKLGDVKCTYIGPTEYDEAKEVQLAQDMHSAMNAPPNSSISSRRCGTAGRTRPC